MNIYLSPCHNRLVCGARLSLVGFLLGAVWPSGFAMAADQPRPPNIVLILADDLGAEAVSPYGGVRFIGQKGQPIGDVTTPNLERLAKEGVLFSNCHATPVCSPSRAQLLTGKYNFRIGFPDILGRNGSVQSLDTRAHPTIAQHLRDAGYLTGVTGKWHLGPLNAKQLKDADLSAESEFAHVRSAGFERQNINSGAHLREYGETVEGRYTPDLMVAWSGRFMEDAIEAKKPFFLYFSSPLPHFPYWPTPLNPDGPRGDQTTRLGALYGDMENFPYLVQYLDRQVGQLLDKLEALGVRDDTLVIFAGDNGTPNWLVTEMRDGRRVRWGKDSLKETGSWVPFIASWPRGIKSPGRADPGLIDFSDVLPSLLELAAAPVPDGLDGVSFAPRLRDPAAPARDWIHVFYVKDYHVRGPRWKLTKQGELFDMSDAPHAEKLIPADQDSPASRAERERLQALLNRLHPSS
jgi:arylsulfatase A-like enzyme